MLEVKIKNTKAIQEFGLPVKGSNLSAGYDLKAYLKDGVKEDFLFNSEFVDGKVILHPGGRALIPTGIFTSFDNEEIYECKIRSRSGLALKKGIFVLNSPGCVDLNDYRNEYGVILANFGTEDFIVNHGERIAQATFEKVETVNFEIVEEIDKTNDRGGGFGHSGSR